MSKFNSARSNAHGYDILIPSTYRILIRKLSNWFLDNWIALTAAIRIELTRRYVVPVSIFVVAVTRPHSQPVYAPAQNNPLSLAHSLGVSNLLSVVSPAASPVSRSRDLESLGGTGVEGPRPGSRCSAGLQAYIIRLRPTWNTTPNPFSKRIKWLQLGRPGAEHRKRYVRARPSKKDPAYSGALTLRDRRCTRGRNAPA